MSWLHALGRRLRGRSRERGAADGPDAPTPEWIVVGLGNPGPRYASTRHNVGFRILETLAERADGAWRDDRALEARIAHVELAGRACALVEPQTFMNRSGRCVAAALARWDAVDPEQRLLIVYDDVDLPTGRIRLRPAGGAGGHRGIGDVLDALDATRVPRLRFGVDRPASTSEVPEWVLEPFSPDEERALPASIARAADAIEAVVRDGLPAAMGQFNASS